jgi:hypothetical protein
LECVFKGHLVAGADVANALQTRPVVRNVLTASVPGQTLALIHFFGPDDWLHSLLVQAVGLGKVENVETDLFTFVALTFPDRANFEVVPLLVASAVGVKAED